jgi:hypothetical protein
MDGTRTRGRRCSRGRRILTVAAIAAAGLVPLWPLRAAYLFSDDFFFLTLLRERGFGAVLASGYFVGEGGGSERFYRPLANVSLLLDLRLWGPNPAALHLTGLALHGLCIGLVWRLAARLLPGGPAAALAAAAFAVMPLHAEPVAFVSARGHLLVALCALAAVLLHARGAWLGSLAATAGALGAQELGLAVPGLLLAHDLGAGRVQPGRLLPHAGLAAAYLALRWLVLGAAVPEGALSPPGGWRLLVRVGLVLGAGAALLWLWWIGRRDASGPARALAFGLAWTPIAALPLMAPLELAPRHFYLSSVGAALAFGVAASRAVAAGRAGALGRASVGLLLVGQAWLLGAEAAAFARLGEQGRGLLGAVALAQARVAADQRAVLVVLPHVPGPLAGYWDYTLPFALEPPFAEAPVRRLLTDRVAFCCGDWAAEQGRLLDRVVRGELGPLAVVEWDEGAGGFATRVMSAEAFRAAGYPDRLSGAA